MEILYFEKKKLFEETFCQVHFSVPSVGCDGRHTIDPRCHHRILSKIPSPKQTRT